MIASAGLLCLLIFATPITFGQSQASTGQIAGAVKDQSGAVVPNARIEARNTANGFKQGATTSESGEFRLVLLPPGAYEMTATAQGFAPAKGTVQVGVGMTADFNPTMGIQASAQEVTVSAELLEVTRHEHAAFVGATVVENIPLNGGRFQDIVNTTPEAQTDPSRGGISMTGQRMVNTGSIHVDGADYGQLFFGGIRGGERAQFAPTIPLDSIQEFQMVNAGYTAEFGRSTGGVITAVTKSGTNSIHGSADYSIRPSGAGKSNEYYDTIKTTVVSQGCTTCVVNPNPTLHQWGGNVGGPLKKDKLFLFGSYQQQRQRLPHQVFFPNIATPFVPTAASQEAYSYYLSLQQPFTQTNDAWLYMIKGDYIINDHHRLSTRYNQSSYNGLNATSVGTALAPTLSSAISNNGTEVDGTRTVVSNLTSFFSQFANELRVQYAWEHRPRIANAQSPTVSNSGVGNFGTVSFLGQNEEHDYRVELADNLTYIKGSHTAKVGFEWNDIYAAQTFGFNQHGSFGSASTNTATWLTSLGTQDCVAGAGCGRWNDTNARYTHQIGNLAATLSGKQMAAFVQDSWKLRSNFTVNYGVRWEGALNPTGVANNAMAPLVAQASFPSGFVEDPGKIPNQLKQFAPRVGFAWDPFGDHKTVVRGFGGMYYAATPLLLYAASVNNFREPPGDLSVQLGNGGLLSSGPVPGCHGPTEAATVPCNTVYRMFNIVGIDLNATTLDKLPDLTIAQVKTIANAILTAQGKAFNPYAGAAPIFTDNNFHNPRSYQSGASVQREITKGWTLSGELTWIKTVYLQRDRDLNVPLAACTDLAGRPIYRLSGAAPAGCTSAAVQLRPISTLGQVVIRDSSAKSLYRSFVVRSQYKKKWGEVNAYYTLSENLDDDYQERSASGVQYLDPYNFKPDYYFSDLDRKHQFVAQPVFFLPWGFDVSSALRVVSGVPLYPTIGSDLNQDGATNDRPYTAVGVPMPRNAFRNLENTNIDLRVQKRIRLSESKAISLSADLFNLFNLMNLTYAGSTTTNYCSTAASAAPANTLNTCGIPSFQGAAANGWTLNPTFMKLRDPSTGLIRTTNNAGTPFEAQFSFRFVF